MNITDNYEGAMTVLDDIEDCFGMCLAIAMRKISLARRARKYEDVERIYEQFIEHFHKKGDKAQANGLTIKYARFVSKVLKDKARAKKIVEDALEKTAVSFGIVSSKDRSFFFF